MLTSHQEEIFDEILLNLLNKRNCTLSGYAGTGKSYVTNMIVRKLKELGKSYIILAPTHKALSVLKEKEAELSSVLEDKIPFHSKFETIASHLKMRPNFDKVGMDIENPDFIFVENTSDGKKKKKTYEFIIIDECSMVSESVCRQLHKNSQPTYLFVGDVAQLPPVNEKESKSFQTDSIFYLTEIIRTKKEDIVALCNLCRSDDYLKVKNVKTSENVIVMSKKDYQYNCEKVLAFTNKAVAKHNSAAKNKLNPSESIISAGDIIMFYQDIFTALVPRPTWLPKYDAKAFYPDVKLVSNCQELVVLDVIDEGPVYKIKLEYDDGIFPKVLDFMMLKPQTYDEYVRKYVNYKNDWDLNKLFSLKYGCMLPEPIKKVYLDEYDDQQSIEIKKTFDLAYALTVHKSQGSTYDSVAIDLNDILSSRSDTKTLLYTAVSRAKNKVILLV